MGTLNVENGDTNAIRYDVIRNAAQEKLTGESAYCARVYAPTKSLREVAETMVREGSKYSAHEVYSILESFAAVVTRLLQEGSAVNVGSLVRFRPSIVGKFSSEDESFARGTHRIKVRASVGSALRDVAASAAVTRISQAVPLPTLTAVYNGLSGTPNTVCSEATMIITGTSLIWNEEAEDEGFFANLEGLDTRCQVIKTSAKNDTAIVLMPHALSEGNEVELSFRTRHTTSGNLALIIYSEMLQYEAEPVD
ncbi:MAG: hypothetical protein IJV69_00885 [Kiritimatiellae bacterium]|nr:hypothetical protein [Kiritimatiellia bacterium]